jgi:dipeptidyl aminopeptidase/acylaminoacyl peptidase
MKPIANELLYQMKFISGLMSSPNHKQVAYLVNQASRKDNDYKTSLYLGNDKQLDLGVGAQAIFLSDEAMLVAYAPTKKDQEANKTKRQTTLYQFDLGSKKIKKLMTVPVPLTLQEMVDADTVLVSAGLRVADHVLYEGSQKERSRYLTTQKETAFVEEIETFPYLFNGQDFMYERFKQFFLLSLSTGTLTPLTAKEFSVSSVVYQASKRRFVLVGQTPKKVRSPYQGVYVVDQDSLSMTTLQADDAYRIDRLFVFENRIFTLASDMRTFGLNQNPDWYDVTANGCVFHGFYGYSAYNTVGTDCRYGASPSQVIVDDVASFVVTTDAHTSLLQLTSDGVLTTVETFDGAVDGIVEYMDRFVLQAMLGTALPELYLYQTALTPFTSLNKALLKGRYVATPEEVVVQKDGFDVKGYVLLPEGYEASQSYPAILNIHGGPKTVYSSVYYHEMQVWANKGYIVFFANPRGSDGKGNEFADIRGRYGTIDYDDLMDFTNVVVDRFAVDQAQLFVTGGSYGGFMTNWIVGHTNRFKRAVTQRSISNWLSFYGTSDIGPSFGFDQAGGHPVQELDKLWEQSPMKYGLNIQTPLLFIHSSSDHRCPIEQAQQLYAILLHQGVETKLVWFHGENHELSRSGKPHARIKRLTEIERWFASA